MSKTIRHVMVIRMGALGDCMHVLPSVATLQSLAPDIQVDWLVSEAFKPLLTPVLENTGGKCWPFAKPKGWLSRLTWLWRLSGQLSLAGVDAVVNLHPSVLTHLLTLLTLFRGGWLPFGRVAVYTKQKLSVFGHQQRAISRLHAVEDFYQPFRRLFGFLPSQPIMAPSLPVWRYGVTRQPERSPSYRIGLVIGVGGKRPNRSWPVTHWQALIQRLDSSVPFEGDKTANSTEVILIGGPEERPLANDILAGLPEHYKERVTNTVGTLSVTELAHTLGQCHVVVGGDTGPLHVAAAAGAPVVIGLFAPTSIYRTGPLGNGKMISITPPDRLLCWPCERPDCVPDEASSQCLKGDTCMGMIRPDVVSDAVVEALLSQ